MDGRTPYSDKLYCRYQHGGLGRGDIFDRKISAEVRKIVSGINWDQVLSGQTPFQDLSFRRKQDEHEVPGSLEFGLRKGLQLPGWLQFRPTGFSDS